MLIPDMKRLSMPVWRLVSIVVDNYCIYIRVQYGRGYFVEIVWIMCLYCQCFQFDTTSVHSYCCYLTSLCCFNVGDMTIMQPAQPCFVVLFHCLVWSHHCVVFMVVSGQKERWKFDWHFVIFKLFFYYWSFFYL